MSRRYREPTDPTVPRADFKTFEEEKRADAELVYRDGTVRDVKDFFVKNWGFDPRTPQHSFERQLARWGIKKRTSPDLNTIREAEFIDLTSPLVGSETLHGPYPGSSLQPDPFALPALGLVNYPSWPETPAFSPAVPWGQERASSVPPEQRSRSSAPAVPQSRESPQAIRSGQSSRAPSRAPTPFTLEGRNTTPMGFAPPQRPMSTVATSRRSQSLAISRSQTPAVDNSGCRYGDLRNMYIPQRGPGNGQATDNSALPPAPRYVTPTYPFNREALNTYQEEENSYFNEAFDATVASYQTSSDFIDDEFQPPMQRDEVRRSRHSDRKKRDNYRSGRDTPR